MDSRVSAIRGSEYLLAGTILKLGSRNRLRRYCDAYESEMIEQKIPELPSTIVSNVHHQSAFALQLQHGAKRCWRVCIRNGTAARTCDWILLPIERAVVSAELLILLLVRVCDHRYRDALRNALEIALCHQ
jgi:hypothetical protein